MWRHSQVALRKPSVCGGHFDVSPLLSLFCISFSHGSFCQRWDAAGRFRQCCDKRGRVRGRGVWGVWCWWLNAALNFTLSQFLTTGTGKEGMRGVEAWRRNRNKSIGERTPASLKKSPFSLSFSRSFSFNTAHTGNHLGWTSSFHPAGWWLLLLPETPRPL